MVEDYSSLSAGFPNRRPAGHLRPTGGYCLAHTNPSNNGGIRAATTLVYRRCRVEISYLQMCTFFRKSYKAVAQK